MLLRLGIAVAALALSSCASLPDEASAIRAAFRKVPDNVTKAKTCASLTATREGGHWVVQTHLIGLNAVGGETFYYLSARTGRLLDAVSQE